MEIIQAKQHLESLVAALPSDKKSLNELKSYFSALIAQKLGSSSSTHQDEEMDEDDCESCGGDHGDNEMESKARTLSNIVAELRSRLPKNALAPGEKITIPSESINLGSNDEDTLHVDGFLYTEDDVDDLVEAGHLRRNKCLNCGSHKTKPLDFVSHSAYRHQLEWLFHYSLSSTEDLLPTVSSTTILDIGSRLGAVLYMAYLHSSFTNIIGLEKNQYFADLSASVVNKFGMNDRVQVVCADLKDRAELLQVADLIVLNNGNGWVVVDSALFQCFMGKNEEIQLWGFLRQNVVRPGQRLICIPSLEEQLQESGADKRIKLDGWVREVLFDSEQEKAETLEGYSEDEIDDINNIHEYVVV
ncbi:hypothetical protein HK098_002302, partial [Nowakowskiella sp. JEL0407]